MQKVADAIFKGALAFLYRQYRTIAFLAIFAAAIVALVLGLIGQGDRVSLAWHAAVAFLIGALCSGISGYIGMYVAVKSNSRTASAATRSLGEALMVSLRGGAVSGFLVVSLHLLGVALFTATNNIGWILFPLVVRAFGLIASALGLLWIRPSVVTEPDKAAGKDPGEIAMNQLNIGYFITCFFSIIGVFLGSFLLLNVDKLTNGQPLPPGALPGWVWFGLAGTTGILLSVAFVYITQYYTAGTWRPVREIAAATLTGPATTIITGVAVGFECDALPVLAISVALFLSFFLGSQVTIHASSIPQVINPGGIFGTAVATMGMLMSCAYILAMDTFGPITDI